MISETGGARLRETNAGGVWTTIAAAIGLTFGPSTIAVLGLGIFIRPIEMEFGWSRTQVSLAATIISYMIVLVSPLQGILTDRFGSRPVVLASIPAFAAAVASFYFLPASLELFYFMWSSSRSAPSACGHSVICARSAAGSIAASGSQWE